MPSHRPILRPALLGLMLGAGATLLLGGPEEPRLRRSQETCQVPDVVLLNQEGEKVKLRGLLNAEQPIVLNFFYTDCTTICPVLCSGFATLQARLGDQTQRVRLVSITIDPEKDTPPVLKAYARRFRGRPGWDLLTGTREDIRKALVGFNTYLEGPSSMVPITMIRTRKGDRWTRVFGLMSSTEFIAECRRSGIL